MGVIGEKTMKVDNVTLPYKPISQAADFPIISADQIKSILYLGLKGDVALETGNTHTVDTYA
jgi:hypothetical protein